VQQQRYFLAFVQTVLQSLVFFEPFQNPIQKQLLNKKMMQMSEYKVVPQNAPQDDTVVRQPQAVNPGINANGAGA